MINKAQTNFPTYGLHVCVPKTEGFNFPGTCYCLAGFSGKKPELCGNFVDSDEI